MTLEDVLAVYEAHPDGRHRPAALGRPLPLRRHPGADRLVPRAASAPSRSCPASRRSRRRPRRPGASSPSRPSPRASSSPAWPTGPARRCPNASPSARSRRPGARSPCSSRRPGPTRCKRRSSQPPSAYGEDTPAVVVVRATWPDEQVVATTLGRLADAIRSTGATTTVLVLVGDALTGRGRPQPSLLAGLRPRAPPPVALGQHRGAAGPPARATRMTAPLGPEHACRLRDLAGLTASMRIRRGHRSGRGDRRLRG